MSTLLRCLLVLICSAALLAPVHAQNLELVSSSPSDGSAGVALTTTVSFTYNLSITSLDLDPGDLASPVNDNFDPGTPTLSSDGRTITYNVTHQPDTDYLWAVAGYSLTTGNETPGVFIHYTTAATIGNRELSGTATLAPEVQGDLDPNNSFVLLTSDQISGDEVQVLNAARVDASGNWTLRYVRDGSYFLYGFNTTETEGAFGLGIGAYDPNSDGLADPVNVTGNASGLAIEIGAFTDVEATEQLVSSRADAEAALQQELGSVPGDLVLVGINGGGAASIRSLFFWTYIYYSASADVLVNVVPNSFFISGTEVDIEQSPSFDTQPMALPATIAPSQAVFSAALAEGGESFLNLFPNAIFTLSAGFSVDAIDLNDLPGGGPDNPPNPPFWFALFLNFDFNGTDFQTNVFAVYLDITTGAVLDTYASDFNVANEDEDTLPQQVRLDANYPNPFNPSTAIPFALDTPGSVQLTVYNVLGEQVATIADGVFPAGTHTVTWDAPAALPSGLYVYRLTAGGQTLARPMLLQK